MRHSADGGRGVNGNWDEGKMSKIVTLGLPVTVVMRGASPDYCAGLAEASDPVMVCISVNPRIEGHELKVSAYDRVVELATVINTHNVMEEEIARLRAALRDIRVENEVMLDVVNAAQRLYDNACPIYDSTAHSECYHVRASDIAALGSALFQLGQV